MGLGLGIDLYFICNPRRTFVKHLFESLMSGVTRAILIAVLISFFLLEGGIGESLNNVFNHRQ